MLEIPTWEAIFTLWLPVGALWLSVGALGYRFNRWTLSLVPGNPPKRTKWAWEPSREYEASEWVWAMSAVILGPLTYALGLVILAIMLCVIAGFSFVKFMRVISGYK